MPVGYTTLKKDLSDEARKAMDSMIIQLLGWKRPLGFLILGSVEVACSLVAPTQDRRQAEGPAAQAEPFHGSYMQASRLVTSNL